MELESERELIGGRTLYMQTGYYRFGHSKAGASVVMNGARKPKQMVPLSTLLERRLYSKLLSAYTHMRFVVSLIFTIL